MDLEDYKGYLDLFNSKDYDAVLEHFTDDCEVVFAGYGFRGKEAVRNFYSFFHSYTKETILLQRFLPSESFIALEAVVRLEGIKDASQDIFAERGLGRLFALAKGQVIEVPQFIHYHMENGKFKKALCAIFEPPVDIITN